MTTIVKHYANLQDDFTHRYTVEYREAGGKFRIFVPECPADPHGNGVHITHRHLDGEICLAPGKGAGHGKLQRCMGKVHRRFRCRQTIVFAGFKKEKAALLGEEGRPTPG